MSSYKVDYKKLFPKGDEFRQEAKKLNKRIVNIHNQMIHMHRTWDGNLWGEFATAWNHLYPDLNRICEFLVKQVPNVIEVDAYNYAVTDGVASATPQAVAPEMIPGDLAHGTNTLTLSDENASEEHKCRENIENFFNDVITSLDRLEDILNSTKTIWISPAAEKSRRAFSQNKETIKADVKKVNEELRKYLLLAMGNYRKQEGNAASMAKGF